MLKSVPRRVNCFFQGSTGIAPYCLYIFKIDKKKDSKVQKQSLRNVKRDK